MNWNKLERAATAAARNAGALMRRQIAEPKRANQVTRYDIKLELDVRCQRLIEARLRTAFPEAAFLGEEGATGDPRAVYRWVVDPIDGTVNFAYGIPHASVSIALQQRAETVGHKGEDYQTVLGVVYDPFCNELWTARSGQPARLNGRRIRVSRRGRLAEAILCIGFAKSRQTLDAMLPMFNRLSYRVRKIRNMGSAALALTYVASGRYDGYIEHGIRLWDIAAGGLIVECAGGEFWRERIPGKYAYRMIVSNGLLRRKIGRF